MWDVVEPFAPLSLFYYYQPDQIIGGTPNWWINITVLLPVAVMTFVAAMVIFERQDLTR